MKPAFLTQCAIIICSISLVFFSGITFGTSLVGYSRSYSAVPRTVPTISLQRIVNQQLEGEVHGAVRFVLGDEIVPLIPNATFRIPATVLLTHYSELTIPEGMQYVASKKGKKYYSVYSKAAESIVPSNRVYFATSQEAMDAGYVQ